MNSRDPGDCVSCGQCLPDCPVYALTRREEDSPRGKLAVLKWFSSFAGPAGFPSGNLPFRCTLCGRCRETCPSKLDVPEMIRAHRNVLGALEGSPAGEEGGPVVHDPHERSVRFRGSRPRNVPPAARSAPRLGKAYRALFTRGPAAQSAGNDPARPLPPAIGAGPEGLQQARLLADALTLVFAPRRLEAAAASLRGLGWRVEVRCAPGPSAWQRFRSGDEGGLLRLARQALDGLSPGEPVICGEPETAELLASALTLAGEGPEARRFHACTGFPAAPSPASPAGNPPPKASGPTGSAPAPGTDEAGVPGSAALFTILPPPLPMEPETWEHWNQSAGVGAPAGWVPAPPEWRALRGEMLVGLDHALAARMALQLRKRAGGMGARTIFCMSTRSVLWLAAAGNAPGLPEVRLL